MPSIWDTTPTSTAPAQAYSQPYAAPTNNWLVPGMNYGQTQDWYNTPISANIREQNPRLAFNAWGGRNGIPENDSTFSRWFNEQQFPRFQSAHGQAILHNPTLTMDQFLATLPNQQMLRNQFAALSPTARGAEYQQYAPNPRWINR